MKHVKRNPLSYLGWLGWIGILGMNTGDFLLQLFVIFFFFFSYTHTPADELFWCNVRKAGFKAFIFGVALNSMMLFILTVIERIGETPWRIGLMVKGYCLSYGFILSFFIGSLIYYNHCEKKYLEDRND